VNGLLRSAAEYLAVRRVLGYRLQGTERFLGQFIDYLEAEGDERITVAHALAWATLPQRGEQRLRRKSSLARARPTLAAGATTFRMEVQAAS
jgi:hypothetical protein